MDEPVQFEVVYTDERIEARGGLALVGRLLAGTPLKPPFDALSVSGYGSPTISHGDVVQSMVGLQCLARPDYAAIAEEASGDLLRLSLGIASLPSAETLRQRLDAIAADRPEAARAIVHEASASVVAMHAPAITPCLRVGQRQWVPLDADVAPFDNSQTRKQGVGRTYKGSDGYAPMFTHLGVEGYQVNAELREGTQHCQKNTPAFLEQAIQQSRSVLAARHGNACDPRHLRLLVRLDAGHDDLANVRVCRRHPGTDWLIKRNLRQERIEDWRDIVHAHGTCERPREGKDIWRGDHWMNHGNRCERVVFEWTQRTTDADGQRLLVPAIELSTWWTSLPPTKVPADKVIELYHDHATSEQFHAELKSDMDLERLPSGKFATNALVLELGMLAYNLLRVTGQRALAEHETLPPADQPSLKRDRQGRRRIRRRRLRRVIQDLMYLAVKLTRSGRRWRLHLSDSCAWSGVCGGMYERLLRLTPT